jgi:hypothetical protein
VLSDHSPTSSCKVFSNNDLRRFYVPFDDQTEARYATGPRIVPSLRVFHVHFQPLGPE